MGAILSLARPAGAGDDYVERLAAQVRSRLAALAASHAPKVVPPTPIAITWKAVHLGYVDLGGPLVAMTAGDLDGDKRTEVYAVTAREVIAIALRNGKPTIIGRVAFQGDRAVPSPRDVVATAVVDGSEVVAAASPWAKELRVSWKGKTLVARPGESGYLVCPPKQRVQLAQNRNYFGTPTNASYAVLCRRNLVDPAGYPLHVHADLAKNGKLAIAVEKCGFDGAACQPAGNFEFRDVGVAFEIADVDHDGTPEAILSEASPPGGSDGVRVISLGSKKPVFQRLFNGGVAGLAVVDADGSGVEKVIAATRLSGNGKLDFWRLD
jgi:hypothetical protein